MTKTFAKGIFYFVATVLFMWTGYLTYSFVASVLPNAHFIVPLFSLVVFDIGTIAWLKVFLDQAEGSNQRAVSIGLSVFDFLGVGLMVLSEVFLGGQTMAQAPGNLGEYAVWGIAIWTVVNVGGVIAFHAFDPEARRKMAIRAEMDAVMEEAYKQLQSKRQENSTTLAHQISHGMMRQVEHDLLADQNKDGIPDIMQPSLPGKGKIQAGPIAEPVRDNAPRQRVAYTVPAIVAEGDGYEVEVMGPERPNGQRPVNRAHQSE